MASLGPGAYKHESALEYVRNSHCYNITRNQVFQHMNRTKKLLKDYKSIKDPERMLKPFSSIAEEIKRPLMRSSGGIMSVVKRVETTKGAKQEKEVKKMEKGTGVSDKRKAADENESNNSDDWL